MKSLLTRCSSVVLTEKEEKCGWVMRREEWYTERDSQLITMQHFFQLQKNYVISRSFIFLLVLSYKLLCFKSDCRVRNVIACEIVQKWLFHFKLFLLSRIIASWMIFCRIDCSLVWWWSSYQKHTTFIEPHKLKEQIFSANVSPCYRRFLSLEMLFALNIWFSNFLSSFGHCYSAGNIFQITLFPGI